MDVCVPTLILAVENKCTEDEMEALGLGALVRYQICPATAEPLSEDLRATEQEQVLMRQHPAIGATASVLA